MYSLGGLLVDRLEFSEVVDDMVGPMLQKSGARVIAVGHATCGATCIASHLNVKPGVAYDKCILGVKSRFIQYSLHHVRCWFLVCHVFLAAVGIYILRNVMHLEEHAE